MNTNAGRIMRGGLSLQTGAIELFGYFLVYMILMLLVIPAGWGMAIVITWFMTKLRQDGEPAFVFHGRGGQIAIIAALIGLTTWAVRTEAGDPNNIPLYIVGMVASAAINGILMVFVLRWVAANTEFAGRQSFRFTGGILPMMGWSVATVLSVFTIVGWAWVGVAYMRWLAAHVIDENDSNFRVFFRADGLSLLWRTLVMAIGCIFIIPIPWVLRWYYAWLISNVEVEMGVAEEVKHHTETDAVEL